MKIAKLLEVLQRNISYFHLTYFSFTLTLTLLDFFNFFFLWSDPWSGPGFVNTASKQRNSWRLHPCVGFEHVQVPHCVIEHVCTLRDIQMAARQGSRIDPFQRWRHLTWLCELEDNLVFVLTKWQWKVWAREVSYPVILTVYNKQKAKSDTLAEIVFVENFTQILHNGRTIVEN